MPGLGLMKMRVQAKSDRERAVPSIGEAVASRADSVHFLFPPSRVDRQEGILRRAPARGSHTLFCSEEIGDAARTGESTPIVVELRRRRPRGRGRIRR